MPKNKTARPRGTDSIIGNDSIFIRIDEIGYLEKIIQQMVMALKESNILPRDFTFSTRQEQLTAFERSLDVFLTALQETDQ